MREWFSNLAPRERVIVLVGAAAAVLIIVWGLIWKPLNDGTTELRDALEQKRALLVDLQRVQALPASGPISAPGDDRRSLVVLVDQTAQSMGLSFTRTRPDGPDAISVSFASAPFDTLVEWLVQLERASGLTVESASFNGTRERGLVSGQVFLRRT
jgi:general secretion pathway protein M